MDAKLLSLVYWPEAEKLWQTMSMCFQCTFRNKVTVVIDCLELLIERPTNLLAKAQTFSSHKHHNTIKILIGITPQGSILCISNLGKAHLTSSLQRTVNFYNICQVAIWSWQNWLLWLHQRKIQKGPHLSKESNMHSKCLHPHRKSDYTALEEVF